MAPLGKQSLVDALASPVEKTLLGELRFHDEGHGYDAFGFDPSSFGLGLAAGRFLYERYFRVESHEIEHVPTDGPAILAANHSGLIPVDAAMVVIDVARRTHPPRVARTIGDVFIPFMPWIGTLMSRMGAVSGSRANFERLLDNGELVLVFPEGVPGIGKGFAHRYELQDFRVGHAELALRHRVPIVPVAVIGAEESWPALAKIRSFHWFGAPFLPLPATPLPLPVRHRIYYGAPIHLHHRWSPAEADDPRVARLAATLVRAEVEALIARGLSERKHLFR